MRVRPFSPVRFLEKECMWAECNYVKLSVDPCQPKERKSKVHGSVVTTTIAFEFPQACR